MCSRRKAAPTGQVNLRKSGDPVFYSAVRATGRSPLRHQTLFSVKVCVRVAEYKFICYVLSCNDFSQVPDPRRLLIKTHRERETNETMAGLLRCRLNAASRNDAGLSYSYFSTGINSRCSLLE